jgi:hypothetical protein
LELRAVFMQLDLLPSLEVVIAIAGGERGPRSRAELEALKTGCTAIAMWLRHGRRHRGYAQQAVC